MRYSVFFASFFRKTAIRATPRKNFFRRQSIYIGPRVSKVVIVGDCYFVQPRFELDVRDVALSLTLTNRFNSSFFATAFPKSSLYETVWCSTTTYLFFKFTISFNAT